MTKSTLLHLRFPFSFFLLPVFLFAWAIVDGPYSGPAILVFVILHFLVYPASNGFNSYFDKDEQSIGGLKTPPKVTKELYWFSLLIDGLALVLGLVLNWTFVLMILVYGLASKAYSHPKVRLKKMPVIGWLPVGIFQGYFTFLTVIAGVQDTGVTGLLDVKYQIPAILSSLLLLGSYPMTQVYQHGEDSKRGDQTISLKLGIMGTFYFTGSIFTMVGGLFIFYFLEMHSFETAVLFGLCQIPIIGYFLNWYVKVSQKRAFADYHHTMQLNFVSALMLNFFFLSFAIL